MTSRFAPISALLPAMKPADDTTELLTVSDAAARLGVTPRTLKYYEELGLVKPTRSKGRYRLYEPADLERFARILRMRSLGFSLTAITELLKQPFEVPADGGRPHLSPASLKAWRTSLATQLDLLEARIAQVRKELKAAQTLQTRLRDDLDYVDQRLAGAPLDVALQRRKERNARDPHAGRKLAAQHVPPATGTDGPPQGARRARGGRAA